MQRILKGQFINKHGIQCLKDYKYKGSSYTYLDDAMQSWWNFFVSFVPLNIAPNVLTLLALVFTGSAVALILLQDVTMNVRMPEILTLWCAFSVFMYQTLDAVDGK